MIIKADYNKQLVTLLFISLYEREKLIINKKGLSAINT